MEDARKRVLRMCRDGLNVLAVLKAMGVESDQEALQLAGCQGAAAGLLVPTLQECKALDIHTQRQALTYLGALPPAAGQPALHASAAPACPYHALHGIVVHSSHGAGYLATCQLLVQDPAPV